MELTMELAGWGRYPRYETNVIRASSPSEIPLFHREWMGLIPRGNGRAYGDAAIGGNVTLQASKLNRMLAFNSDSGVLTVEAGVLLSDIINVFIPRGFFPPVVPGTKFVTIGGMVAADVHGKNHHRDGGFGHHVISLKLILPDGEMVTCSPSENAELLLATIGGMGLTGTIVEVTFRLRRVETGWMRTTTVVASDLEGAIKALRQTSDATYSVAWIDCLARGAAVGRSLIYVAEHATLADLSLQSASREPLPPTLKGRASMPFDLPSWMLNRTTMTLFNSLYFRSGAGNAKNSRLVHWDPYFFPLDGIGAWNRIYGRRGFVQHQSVLPAAQAGAALGEILERVSSHGGNASFLAVLKQLGDSSGIISFPLDGFTLAIDFPVSPELFPLLDEIDRIVVKAGGRIYLAKDARQSRETFEAGYPGLAKFRNIRRMLQADGRIASRLSERLGI
jgi:decaprenylphospho-beta-D-ribofuranose 2-oxidase